ncbi:MAG: hydrolase, partial [Parvibaculum sp.]|nr:hydrolase [Parvibaculum sp.]
AAIHVRFGLPALLPEDITALIKRADKASAYFEATQLAGFSTAEGLEYFGSPRGVSALKLAPLPAAKAQIEFVERFKALLPGAEQRQ